MAIQFPNISSINQNSLYINGLKISNGDNNQILIDTGICRDSSNSFDICLGVKNSINDIVESPLTINPNINGVNGLDEGQLMPFSVYGIYLIADSKFINPTAGIISLNYESGPNKMPFGYDSYRLIGYIPTDEIPSFWNICVVGNSNKRTCYFIDDMQVLSQGNATTITKVNLIEYIPNVNYYEMTLKIFATPSDTNNVFHVYGNSDNQIISQGLDLVISNQLNLSTIFNIFSVSPGEVYFQYSCPTSNDYLDIYLQSFTYYI